MHHTENHQHLVLVVSPNDAIIGSILSILDQGTYTVITAKNGMEALSIVTYRMPHVIITEIDIPVISGFEFIRRLKKGVKTRFIPCILVGPADDISSKIEAIDAGADSYVTLPVNSDELRVLVKSKITQSSDLYMMTISDDLTRLPTRKEFIRRFNLQVDEGFHDTVSLVIIDIDYFKSVNDDYGHQVGDMVLITLADLLHDMECATFFPARFGGEEFVILLPGIDAAGARDMADQLRTSFELIDFQTGTGENSFNVTFSGGVAEYPTMAENLSGLMARADQALYAAKNDGRNRCYVFSPIMARNDRFWEYIKSTKGGRGTFISFPYNESVTGFPYLPFVMEEILTNEHPVASLGIFSLNAAPMYDPFVNRGIRNYLYDIESLAFFLPKIFDAHFPYERYVAVSDLYSFSITVLFPFPTNVSQNRDQFYNLCRELALDIYLYMNNYPVDIVFANHAMEFDRSSPRRILEEINHVADKKYRIFGKKDDFSSFSSEFVKILHNKKQSEINNYLSIRPVLSIQEGSQVYNFITNHHYTTRNDYGDLMVSEAFGEKDNMFFFNEFLLQHIPSDSKKPLLYNHPPRMAVSEMISLLSDNLPGREIILMLDECMLESMNVEDILDIERSLPGNISLGINNCYIGSQLLQLLSVITLKLVFLSESITRNIHLFKERIKIINGLKMFADQLGIPLCARNIILEEEFQLVRDLKIDYCTGPYAEQVLKKMHRSRK